MALGAAAGCVTKQTPIAPGNQQLEMEPTWTHQSSKTQNHACCLHTFLHSLAWDCDRPGAPGNQNKVDHPQFPKHALAIVLQARKLVMEPRTWDLPINPNACMTLHPGMLASPWSRELHVRATHGAQRDWHRQRARSWKHPSSHDHCFMISSTSISTIRFFAEAISGRSSPEHHWRRSLASSNF